MHAAQYSSLGSGHEPSYANDGLGRHSAPGRGGAKRAPSIAPWRKFFAVAVVVIMLATAFVMLAPFAKAPTGAPAGGETKAGAAAEPPNREVTYTISRIGESYLKNSSLSAMGRHESTPGVNEWWEQRRINYGDTVIHNAFPYSIGYNPNSAYNTYNKINHAGYIMVSFARFEMDAKNLTTIATGPNKDPILIPLLGGIAGDGGTVVFNWYATYITSGDVAAIKAGTHYANLYYGVPAFDMSSPASYANDGWYFEHQGIIQFDRLGANKFLNLPATGDLRDEFNTSNAGWTLSNNWANHWKSEGSPNAIYDIFACYDYPLDPIKYWLTLDPSSTADQLVVRMWGYSWGMDALLMRFMDVTGLMNNFNVWPEDWYLNGTITSTGANIQSRMVTIDHITNWKDYSVYTGAWMMEPVHADWTWADASAYGGWVSRYNPYDAYALTYRPGKEMWAPGSNYYGTGDTHTTANTVQGVAYWITPRAWDLVAGEKIVVKLADAFWAVKPYKGVATEDFGKGGSTVKKAEVLANGYWGEMVLGHGPDATLYSASYYDSAAKTLTFTGPMNFTDDDNTQYPSLEQTGSPLIVTAVSRVSDYSMRIVEPGPYGVGNTYTLEVTAKNFTGVTVTDWNGTVDLSVVSGGATLGASSLTFVPADNGVKTTTITFTAAGAVVVGSADRGFPLDVATRLSVNVGPPPTFDLSLVKGWNFVCVPLAGSGYKASTLGLMFGDVVAGWNSTLQTYDKGYIVGISPPAADFAIVDGAGYWIYAGAAETLHLKGSVPTGVQSTSIQVPSGGGWAAVGLQSLNTTRYASAIPPMYSGGSISMVVAYDPVTGTYKAYYTGLPFTDFLLVPGQGLWLWCTASGTLTYQP